MIKLNSNMVVKLGCSTIKGEAATQTEVYRILNATIVQVPQVYGLYRDDKRNVGYIAMEDIDGHPIDLHNTAHLKALRRVFEHLASFQRILPWTSTFR